MNYIKRFVVTAVIFCSLLLGWVYLLGELMPEEPTTPLWQESLSQLHELYRITFRQSHNTLQQASQLSADSLPTIAVIMRVIAESERIHCRICQRAIESLGDNVSAPSTPDAEPQPTMQVIEQKLAQKERLNRETLPQAIGQALSDENRYIARMLTWYNANNNHHIRLLKASCGETMELGAVSDGAKKDRTEAYYLCPTCGHIEIMELAPYCCPHCMTSRSEFMLFK